ncbi:MAG TPA: hypothetical protein ENJ56_08395, partial [Anaerolineae bacterium]|nr:hypothetical protein [Anaerolineae bacterium]
MKQRDILKFWLPLVGSWLLLTMEGPLVTMAVNRLADPVKMLAATGIVISLSVFIESPIINMLATATANVVDLRTYKLVRNFTLQWAALLTLIHILIGYTPLFDLVVLRGMGVPAEIALLVRVGMKLMILWSAAIAWRRFLQGVLIHFNHTRAIVVGTAVRLVAGILMLAALVLTTELSGIVIAAAIWTTGVSAEAIYVTIVSRSLFKWELSAETTAKSDLTYRKLLQFHLPLASTSALSLLLQPLVVFSLAKLAQSDLTLAAWPLLFQILLIARAPALSIPEVIIALNKNAQQAASLRRFIKYIGIASLLGTLFFVFTPLSAFYLDRIQNVDPAVAVFVQQGLALTVLFPVLTLSEFALRGFLISQQHTRPVNVGMMINLTLSAVMLAIGTNLAWSGITTAAVALNVAIIVEIIYLTAQGRNHLQP